MSILLNRDTAVIVLGITGKQGRKLTREMLDYGTKIVAGVTPGKGGDEVDEVPVYNTVGEALKNHPEANTCLVSVPRDAARAAAVNAIATGKFSLVNVLTEGIPIRDSAEIVQAAEDHGVRVIGPASVGAIVPSERVKIGAIGGSDAGVFYPGRIAIFSKSGGMCLSISMDIFNKLGYGVSVVVGMGGDLILGTTFKDLLAMVRDDPDTRLVVLNGELGGTYEEDAAAYIRETGFPKRVIARLTGVGAEAIFPVGSRMGHAGAIIGEGNLGTYESKVRAFEAAGVSVAKTGTELITLVEHEMPASEGAELDKPDSLEPEIVSISKTKLEGLKAQVRAVQTKTSLTAIRNGMPYFRGYPLPDLMRKAGILEMRFMALKREDPTPDKLARFRKICNYCFSHLPEMGDAVLAAVSSYKMGNPLNAACAAGLLALPVNGGRVPMAPEAQGFMTPTEFEALSLVAQTTHIVGNVLGHRLMGSDDRSAEAVFFLAMNGRLPTPVEADLTRAVYVACLDHTPATPSSLAGLVSYSGGNSLKTALAAAITAMGDVHAGAGEGTAETLQEYIPAFNEAMKSKGSFEADGRAIRSIPELAQYIVDKTTGKFGDPKSKVPGYGHRYYGLYGKDPRAVTMIELAREHGVYGQYIQLALEIEKVLRDQKNTTLCMNVDGVIGAVFSEIGMDWHAGKATFIIPRTVGVLGELLEQRAGSFFRLANESTVYVGPELGREYHPVAVAV